MKKSTFVAFVLSVIGVLLLGIGMCMSLLPDWNLFREGICVGIASLLVLISMVFIYRKMEHKEPIKITFKNLGIMVLVIIGMLSLGGGMSLTMVYGNYVSGMLISIVGIVMLLCLIPICVGFKD